MPSLNYIQDAGLYLFREKGEEFVFSEFCSFNNWEGFMDIGIPLSFDRYHHLWSVDIGNQSKTLIPYLEFIPNECCWGVRNDSLVS